MQAVLQPWPWYVAGPLIAFTALWMVLIGRRFGVSSNLKTVCSMCGGGRAVDFFRFDWKRELWNMLFIGGAALGGFLSFQFLTPDPSVAVSAGTQAHLAQLGLADTSNYLPPALFSWSSLLGWQGWVFMVLGGFLVGFGARYANGCTSGHAISGLANLQGQSLVAVIGFFIGGLVMTWLVIPNIL